MQQLEIILDKKKSEDKSEKTLTGPIRWIAIIALIVLAMTTKTNFGNFINFENIGELIKKLQFLNVMNW